MFQALSIFLVNDLYIGDPLEQIKHRKCAYSSKTLLMNTLNSGRVNHLPSSMYRQYNHIPQSKSMHIMPRGHIETDPSTSSYFVTSEGSIELSGKVSNWPFSFQMQACIQLSCKVINWPFRFRSNPVSKIYQHRSRNGWIFELALAEFYFIPPQTLFVVGILFSRCPCVRACVCVRPCVCPSVRNVLFP